MSEFSNSYHLQTESIEVVTNLLKECGLSGYVFKPKNGWVSFVIEEDAPNQDLITNNPGLLVHYQYAEDICFIFSIYEKEKEISHYECIWEVGFSEEFFENETDFDKIEDEIIIKDKKLNLAFVYSLLKNKIITREEFNVLLHPQDFEDIFANEIALQFAELLELPNFNWISYHYLSLDEENNDFEHDCVKVSI